MGKKYDELKCLFDDYREYHSLGARLVRKIEKIIKLNREAMKSNIATTDIVEKILFAEFNKFNLSEDLKSKFAILVCGGTKETYNELKEQGIEAHIISSLSGNHIEYIQIGSVYGSIDICDAGAIDRVREKRFDSEYLLISSSIPSNVVSHFMPSFPNIKQVVYFDEVL